MLTIPGKFALRAGRGEGGSPLNAFDAALMAAGIGHLNLLRVSSILPPGAQHCPQLTVPPGAPTPTAYGYLNCSEPGRVISAAIGVGISHDTYGVIMEFEGYCNSTQAEESVRAMVEEGMRSRGLRIKELLSLAVDHCVENHGSVVAAAILWY